MEQSPTTGIALVTGANKGIGFEIARQLGKAGNHILIGARDPERGRSAAALLLGEGVPVRYVGIDLTNRATIEAAAAEIGAQEGRLDILVNNAGLTSPGDGTPGSADIEAVRRCFDTNFFGTLVVTQAMLPLLKRSAAARIVNVSSGLGSITRHGDPDWEFSSVKLIGYCASKAALNMLTVQLAAELRAVGIKVNSADPGFTGTDLNNHRGYQTVAQGAAEAVRLALLPDDGPTGCFFSSNGVEPW
jgi:NAD(P)-dependent dehydrogenase (short-subunit alcohol dehydrogenase family)